MRGFLPSPHFLKNLKKTSIYRPRVKMGLKTVQNIKFWAFLVFPFLSISHQHFGVATSEFLSCDIIILDAQHNVAT